MKIYHSFISYLLFAKNVGGSINKCNFVCRAQNRCSNNFHCLTDITLDNSKPFIPKLGHGKVVKVYDGDTITVASRYPDVDKDIYRYPVRLRGIDAPELRSEFSRETELAEVSRDALYELIFGKIVRLDKIKIEKYGRLLADVYIDNIHVNKWLLDNKYAIPYDGKKKNKPTEWTL
jgi:endonuclease YncB( thermonuclease family)